MRFNSLMFVSVAAALLATPALAQTAASTAAPVAKADPLDEVVCKREEETGSLVKKKKKVCATRRQWEAHAVKSRAAFDQGQMSGGSSSPQ